MPEEPLKPDEHSPTSGSSGTPDYSRPDPAVSRRLDEELVKAIQAGFDEEPPSP